MKDTYGKRTYKCKCGTLNEQFVWSSEIEQRQFECTKCGKWFGHDSLLKKEAAQSAAIRTPTKNR